MTALTRTILSTAALAGLSFGTAACGKNAGEAGHTEGEAGHAEGEGEAGHEEGVVELTPEAAEHAGIETTPATARPVPFVVRTTARIDYDEGRIAHVGPRIAGRVAEVSANLGDEAVVVAGAFLLKSELAKGEMGAGHSH